MNEQAHTDAPPAWMADIRAGTLSRAQELEAWCRDHGKPRPTLWQLHLERQRRGQA